MLRPTKIALLFILSITPTVEAGGTVGTVSVEEMAYQEMRSVILLGKELGLDRSALILTLGYADNPSARQVLVEIADYYLGSAVSESVVSSISRHGQKIVSDLDEAIDRESKCVATDNIQCLSEQDRDKFLRSLRDIAESGELVEYVW